MIGPSAPFGARKGYVPYVAPENGKTYQLPVDLGPDAAIPSLSGCPSGSAGPQYNRPPLSSGFAPYALARLVTETGGIYFMSNMTTMAGLAPLGHYDAAAMRPFEPDYSYASPADCLKDVISRHPLRMAVYNASIASRTVPGQQHAAVGHPRHARQLQAGRQRRTEIGGRERVDDQPDPAGLPAGDRAGLQQRAVTTLAGRLRPVPTAGCWPRRSAAWSTTTPVPS